MKDVIILGSSHSGLFDENSLLMTYSIMGQGTSKCGASVTVRRGPVSNTSELEVLEVRPGYWVTARHWVRKHFGNEASKQAQMAYHWQHTDKPFRSMELPTELRQRIIEF